MASVDVHLDAIRRTGELPTLQNTKADKKSDHLSMTNEELNMIKLTYLVLRLAPQAVRVFFDKMFPPRQLCSRLNQFKHFLKKLRDNDVISQYQWEEILYKPTGNSEVRSTSFDFGLQLILLEKLGKIKIGDDLPDLTTTSIYTSLTALKYYHNYIMKTKHSSIGYKDFEIAFGNLEKAIGYIDEANSKEDCNAIREMNQDHACISLLVSLTHLRIAIVSDSKTSDSIIDKFALICQKMEWVKGNCVEDLKVEVIQLINSVYSIKGSMAMPKSDIIDEWKLLDARYIPTKTTTLVETVILNNKVVVITGEGGIGKSVTVRHVALRLNKKGFDVIPITHPELIAQNKESRISKIVFIIDKFLSHSNNALSDLEKWEGCEENILSMLKMNSGAKLVFTVGNDVITRNPVKVFLKKLNSNVLDMSDEACALSTDEYEEICKSYLVNHEIETVIRNASYTTYLPLLCRLFMQKKDKHISTEFLTNTKTAISSYIDNLYKEDEYVYFFLLILVVRNGKVEVEYLKDDKYKRELQDMFHICFQTPSNLMTSFSGYMQYRIRRIKGFFIEDIKDGYASLHPTIFYLVLRYFIERHSDIILKYGKCDLICNKISLKSSDEISQNDFKTLIDSKYDILFCDRLINDLENGKCWSIFSSVLMSNDFFRKQFISHLRSRSIDGNNFDYVESLYIASKWGYKDLVEYLLETKENKDICTVRSKNGKTALWAACFSGFKNIADALLFYNANINKDTSNGETPLYIASKQGHIDVVNLMIKHNADVNKHQKDGITPLCISIWKNDVQVAMMLLRHGADVNHATCNGTTPLHIACHQENQELIDLLLDYQANVNNLSNDGITPLHIGCYHGNKNTVRKLLENRANVNQMMLNGITPCFIASEEGHTDVVAVLLRNNADNNQATDFGYIPLYVASLNGHDAVVDLLKEHKGVRFEDGVADQMLFYACKSSNEGIIDWLLLNNVDVNARNKDGDSGLHIAASCGYKHIAIKLLIEQAKINTLNNNGVTPLYEASRKGNQHIVELLVRFKADINLGANLGYTPMYAASENGHTSLAAFLISHGAQVNLAKRGGISPLFIACHNGHTHTVHMLLEHKAYVNHATHEGETPLHVSCTNGHLQITELLLGYHANINQCDINGNTPLYNASKSGHQAVVSLLLNNFADANLKTTIGESPLFVACLEGHTVVAELLVNANADLNLTNDEEYSPLQIASDRGHTDIIKLITRHVHGNTSRNIKEERLVRE